MDTSTKIVAAAELEAHLASLHTELRILREMIVYGTKLKAEKQESLAAVIIVLHTEIGIRNGSALALVDSMQETMSNAGFTDFDRLPVKVMELCTLIEDELVQMAGITGLSFERSDSLDIPRSIH